MAAHNYLSTYKTYLMMFVRAGEQIPGGSSSTTASTAGFYKLCDIKSFPDIGSSPNMLETTTLDDDMQTFIPGIKQLGDGLEFTVNYEKSVYKYLRGIETAGAPRLFALWKGATTSGSTNTPTGNDGMWEFDGRLTVTVSGGGVDEVVNMTVSIAPSGGVDPVDTASSDDGYTS